MTTIDTALDDYRRRCELFIWAIPPTFNFARDVVDHFAADPLRPATYYRGADGKTAQISFASMSDSIHRCAGLLQSLNIQKGERIMVLLPRIPEWQIATVGALAAGVVAVPTSMALLSPRDIQHRLNHCSAVAVIATPDAIPAVNAMRAELPALRHCLVVTENNAAPRDWIDFTGALAQTDPSAGRPTDISDPALIFYTSGTTGPPKGVLHNHSYTLTGTRQASIWHGIEPNDRFWPTTGWAKAAFGPWSVGAEIVIVNQVFDAATQLELLRDLRPNVFCAPPTQYRLMAKLGLGGLDLPALRHCVAAGEPLNPEIIRVWREATGITIRDGYGQSEAGLLIANLADLPVKSGSMGLALPGYEIAIIDDAGRALPAGATGDLAVRYPAPGLFMRYWNDPNATRKCFRGDWYLTGDQAARDPAGWFWFMGRSDDIIISGSHRIGPFDVESLLVEHPAVLEAAAIASPDADLGHVVKAVIVLRPGVDPNPVLIAALQQKFANPADAHKMPAIFEFVASLPKTATGKIQRSLLRAL